MLRFSPCLEIFFNDQPFPERIKSVASLGYTYYEFWSWWDKDIDAINEMNQKTSLIPQAFCTKFISLVDPAKRNAYLDGLGETIEVAMKLKARIIISQTGNAITELPRHKQQESLITGLEKASDLLKGTGLILAIEPLNVLVDHPGYFLVHSDEAAEIIKAVNSPNIAMLFDIYHQQISEGNLIPGINKHFQHIAHFHIADHPGRHEPGTGEINYKNILHLIDQLCFTGTIGLEFFPLQKDHRLVLRDPLFAR